MERNISFEYQNKPLAYNPLLDREVYINSTPEELPKVNSFTKKQLETHLGERFNVLQSSVRYEISDNHLCAEGTAVPAIDSFKKGIGRTGTVEDDLPRELAEIEGFSMIDAFFGSEERRHGDKILSISAPSGSYKHKFYDIFTYKNDINGSYVEMNRFSSGLTINETVDILIDADIVSGSYNADVNYALSNPIVIKDHPRFKTAEDIHRFLHKDHDYSSKEDFDQVLKICAPFITGYINTLVENPKNLELQVLYYNALLNQADLAYDSVINRNDNLTSGLIFQAAFTKPNLNQVRMLGQQEVKSRDVGCGYSGGFKINQTAAYGQELMNSPFSVVDFIGENAKDDPSLCKCGGKEPHFHCPGKDEKGHDCENAIVVGKGIKACPKCGAGKVC